MRTGFESKALSPPGDKLEDELCSACLKRGLCLQKHALGPFLRKPDHCASGRTGSCLTHGACPQLPLPASGCTQSMGKQSKQQFLKKRVQSWLRVYVGCPLWFSN